MTTNDSRATLDQLAAQRAELVDQLAAVDSEITETAITVAGSTATSAEEAEAELSRMMAASPAIAATFGLPALTGTRDDVARLVDALVHAHRATIEPALRGLAGDALDLSLRAGGTASMRRHGRRIALGMIAPVGPGPHTMMDRDEAEEVALSLLTAVVDARAVVAAAAARADAEPVEVVEVADDARAARLRTAYETGNHDADGGPW